MSFSSSVFCVFGVSFLNFIKKWFHDIDVFTLFFAIFLMSLGLIMSLSVSPAMANRINISNYHFASHHIVFCFIGIFVMLFCSMLSKSSILSFAYIGYFCCLCFLVLVLFIGSSTKGSHRWISFGFFALQPAELMKPFFIIINSYLLSISNKGKYMPILAVGNIGVLAFLFILQPDFGTTIIYISIWLVQVFLGTSKFNVLLYSMIFCGCFVAVIGFFFFPHFHYRIVNFFTLRGGHEQYQTKKAMESIYNGGLFGRGLGEGEVKYQLPDAHTDYIFSVVCEELGIIFASLLLLLVLIFIYRHIVSNFTSRLYEMRIIYGFVFMFVFQSIIHVCVNTNLIPSKGMTFPFLSYGGSSMLSNSIIFGFLLAFTRKSYRFKSPYKIFEDAYITR